MSVLLIAYLYFSVKSTKLNAQAIFADIIVSVIFSDSFFFSLIFPIIITSLIEIILI